MQEFRGKIMGWPVLGLLLLESLLSFVPVVPDQLQNVSYTELESENVSVTGWNTIEWNVTKSAYYSISEWETNITDRPPMKEERTVDPERLLRAHLLKGYNKAVRPSRNYSEVLTVTLGVALTQIISLDERNQILTSNCWLSQIWIDDKLSWNPEDFANITSLLIPVEQIFRPDILLYNNADSEYYHKMISTNAIIQHTGNVTWLSTSIIRSTCEIDVRFFPFDKQVCSLKFASWTFDGFAVDLVVVTEVGDISNYLPSMEWDLKNFTAKRNIVYYSCCAEPYPDITMTLSMQRRPHFYIYNHLAPCGVATLFAFLGFYAPGESGEKVTLGITTLLSLTLFMLMVGEAMPPTATTLPLITLYYGFCLIVIGLSTAVQVFTLNIHYRGARGREAPLFLKHLAGIVGQALLVRGRASLLRHSVRRKRPTHERRQSSGEALFHGSASGSLTTPARKGRPSRHNNEEQAPLAASELVITPVTPDEQREDDLRNQQLVRTVAHRLTTTLSQVCKLIDNSERRYKDRVYFDEIAGEWTDIAHVLDKLLLVTFLAGTFGLTLAMFIDVPYLRDG
ncbi:Neuronal acetylcholine receptor subunit alpha-10 [Hypsibius exemplaris]|uniref:Neuronal acetylcholine receptor subunit alpha-10 n=1 Tax=Hypsibius exemplaris TaxID=2072580 RepID=A0A1W0WYP4_HYPEX|nr:Neuronal acetylcholine receptor subunit alpha-10 [Hypsibius exemplaris]